MLLDCYKLECVDISIYEDIAYYFLCVLSFNYRLLHNNQ